LCKEDSGPLHPAFWFWTSENSPSTTCVFVNRETVQALSVEVCWGMRKKEDLPKLPEGYHLDLASDPDAPVLRRPDGTAAARFSARGMTEEAIEREALEDMLHRIEEPQGRGPG
jgi:hypothetical protein